MEIAPGTWPSLRFRRWRGCGVRCPHAAAACSASPPRSRSGLSATGPPAHVPARRLSRQRPLAPRGPGPFDAAGREVELAGRQLLYPERVHEGGGVLPEGHPQHARRRQEPERPPRLGVHLRHEQRAVRRRQPVEPGPGALGQQLPDLHVVLLARALLLALPGVAVEEPGLAVPLAEQRRDGALVGELAPVVSEHGAEGAPRAVLAEDPAQGGERRQDRGARAVRQRQGQLEAARAVQEREEPGGVAPGALDGVHLPGRGAGVLAEREERRVRPARRVGRRPLRGPARPRPVADLAPELHVRHAVVAGVHPPVDGGGAEPGGRRRYLLRGEPAREPVPDGRELGGGALLGLVDPGPARRELGVGRLLRPPGAVEHPGPPRAAVAPPVRAAVAAPRPRGEPGAGPRQVRGRGLAVARARRGDVAVRRHLPGHGRGRPAELRGDLAGAAVAVEHPLDRVPLVPREPPVRPSGRLGSGHAGLPPSRAGGFRPLWGCLPGFAPQDSAQRVALSPEAVAMKMRIKAFVCLSIPIELKLDW